MQSPGGAALSKRILRRKAKAKRPTDFLLRDGHDDVLEADEFKQFWWQIRAELLKTNDTNSLDCGIRTAMSILQSCASVRVLHVKQMCSIMKLFDSDCDRLEILEFFVLRCHKLLFKGDLIPLFHISFRPYIAEIVEESMLVEPTEGIPMHAMLFRNKLLKSSGIVYSLLSALERIHFNKKNQSNVVTAILSQNCLPLSHRQAYRILCHFVDDVETLSTVLDLINRFVIGFTCREISLLLNKIESVPKRMQVLKQISTMILDAEHRWITLDAGFSDVDDQIREQVALFLHDLSVLPRSFIFGSVVAQHVCFVIDTTESMSTSFITSQGERITRLRFVVRELTRVLRHQLTKSTHFNIVAFGAEASAWSTDGCIEATRANVAMACDWLRGLKPFGPTNVVEALELAFQSSGSTLEAVYFVTDGDPTRGIDYEMNRIQESPALNFNRFENPPKVHVCGVVLGNHDLDNAAQTEVWVLDLAQWGGGLARFLVDETYDNTVSSSDLVRKSSSQNVDRFKGGMWQITNVCSFTMLCLFVWMTHFSEFRGAGGIAARRTYSDLNSMFPTFLAPLDSIFYAWNVLLAFMAVNLLYLSRIPLCLFRKNISTVPNSSLSTWRSALRVQLFLIRCQLGKTGWKTSIWHITTLIWIMAVQAEFLVIALVFAFLNLFTLISLHQSLRIGKHPMKYDALVDVRLAFQEGVKDAKRVSKGNYPGPTDENDDDDDDNGNGSQVENPTLPRKPNGILLSERLFMCLPVSISLSWVSFALSIQFAQYLQSREWFGWGWQEEWALVLVCILFLVACVLAVVLDDAAYAMITAITHFAIAMNNFSESRSIGDLSRVKSVYDFSYGFMIYVAAMTTGVVLIVFSLKSLAKGTSELLYKTLFQRLRDIDASKHKQAEVKALAQKAHKISWNQTLVFALWCITALVSLLADENVNKVLLNLETPFINHITFLRATRLTDFPDGDVSQFTAAVRVIPSTFFFAMFFCLYGLLLAYVILQALPLEEFGSNIDYLVEEDNALEKNVFVRGTQQRWSKRNLCCGCCPLPLIHKWRLTPIAVEVLISKSNKFFLGSCLFNVLFVICYLHKQYLASLLCCLLLFFTVAAWYKHIDAWHIHPDPKSKEEIAVMRQEFESAHANEATEIMNEKWDAMERRITKTPRHVSTAETFTLHMPVSAYLGLLSFMLVFVSAQFTILYAGIGPGLQNVAENAVDQDNKISESTSDTSSADTGSRRNGLDGYGWNLGDWYEEGWAWSMVGIAGVLILITSFKNKDPILPLAFSVGTYGMFVQNTAGTCSWDTPSGIAIRKPDSENSNQKIKPLKPESGPNEYYQRGGVSGGRLHWFWNLTDDNGAFVDSSWSYTTGLENKTSSVNTDRLQPAYWCKKAVEQGYNNGPEDGPAWAFRHQDGKHFTYYDETRNKNGDYVYLQGRCRRIYKDANDEPITAAEECQNLGTQRPGNPDVVRGFYWIENLCVEDPGTCSFVHGKSPITSHTPEYILAVSSLWTTLLLWAVGLLMCLLRYKRHKTKLAEQRQTEQLFAEDML